MVQKLVNIMATISDLARYPTTFVIICCFCMKDAGNIGSTWFTKRTLVDDEKRS